MEYPQAFDVASSVDKAKLRQLIEVSLLLALISWSTPAALKAAAGHAFRSSALLNHHVVVFLIGNSIVALLFALFRRHNHHDDHEPLPSPPREKYDEEEEEKKIVVVREAEEEEDENHVVVVGPQCDDVAMAIEKATRQIRRFERTQSERLRREIGARQPRGELRRSVSSGEKEEDMERLSSDEFRRTVDDFISKHWTNKTSDPWM